MTRQSRWPCCFDWTALDNFMRTNFGRPDLVLILDFWHAASQLADLARTRYGSDVGRVQAAPEG